MLGVARHVLASSFVATTSSPIYSQASWLIRVRGEVAALMVLAALAPRAARGNPSDRGTACSTANMQKEFEDALAGLGEWVTVADQRVWRPPNVRPDWRPYFYGSWTWMEQGWFWVSDEPWAAATYHYGRWNYDGGYGWVWVPGCTWAPAWVVWRFGDGVVGWAPLATKGGSYSAFWTFVPSSRFVGERVEAMAFPAPRIPLLLLKTRPMVSGPLQTRFASR
ncbi:MAG TPA: DUF6600 domain-containing protein [Anaeromyxobacteraceae bacterium]|nr:DUF6600 domain-containing protein [Anaeromyxobacteraceae bacterium]